MIRCFFSKYTKVPASEGDKGREIALPCRARRRPRNYSDWLPAFWCCALLSCACALRAADQVWILVETDKQILTLMNGNRPELVIRNIALGRYGTTSAKRKGDRKTPLGEFRIAWIKRDSRFHRFLGLDYPNLEHGRIAYEEGRLSAREWDAIRNAAAHSALPPQDTPLGGQIGLHGIGEGNLAWHEQFNWTNGCIALTNEQIDLLLDRVDVGTRVVIR